MKLAFLLSLGAVTAGFAAQWGPARTFARSRSADAPDLRPLVTAQNALGIRLLARLAAAEPQKNVLLSPYGVATALSLALNGAGGTTRDAMAQTLGVQSLELSRLNRLSRELRESLLRPEPKVVIQTGSAVWSLGRALDRRFSERIARAFQAESSVLDAPGPAAAEKINRWVRGKTAGEIREIIGEQELSSADSAILTNALYFKGAWSAQFDPARTREGWFTRADGAQLRLQMMSRTGRILHAAGGRMEAVSLPCGQGRISMLILLPARKSSLGDLLAGIDADRIAALVSSLTSQSLALTLPRHSVDYEAELAPALSDMGMSIAFGPSADFSPMGLADSWIRKVKHRTRMKVNEEGATAAAATAVVMSRGAAPSFIVDRPFLCAVRDNATGALLFLGAIREPRPI